MIAELFFRQRFNNLVSSLRENGELDEEKLAMVLAHRKYHTRINHFFLGFLAFPALVYIVFLIFDYGQNPHIYEDQMFGLINQVVFLLALVCLCFYLYKDGADKEWQYVSLMTNGIRTKGKVNFSGENFRHASRVYDYNFFTQKSEYIRSKFKLPIKMDHLERITEGQEIDISYDSANPQKSMIVTLEFEIFNLRKGKEDV